ncbi:MAG: hypothetical protein IJ198_06295 [Lachnospiraceae bacterium]|nr:hypothetical protein [Lachnospiraceae bacterium]
MWSEMADVFYLTAGYTATTFMVRALRHPPVREPGEVFESDFVQNS